jgi:hypothetical protein
MVDLNVMASNIKDILSNVPGIKAAYDHEPQAMTHFPAATLYFDSFTQNEATINRSTVNWDWTIRLYIPFNSSDVKTPQMQVRNFVMDTIKQLRTDLSLGGSCLYHTVSNGDIFASLEQTNPMMIAEITLVALTQDF